METPSNHQNLGRAMMEGNHTLASDTISEEEGFSDLVPLQPEGLGAFETVFPMAQGRGNKLVTEDWKPVGSGQIIYSSFYY